jgi:hypothetical protein
LAVALFPQRNEWVDPATGDRVIEHRMGLWFSPVHRSVRREHPQGGFTWRAGINWFSWSSLLVVVGVVCFGIARQRRSESRTSGIDTADVPRSDESAAEANRAHYRDGN